MMVSTYWAELPARLTGHPDANGRFIPSPAHQNLGVMAWAEAFLRVSADYLAIEVGQSCSILEPCVEHNSPLHGPVYGPGKFSPTCRPRHSDNAAKQEKTMRTFAQALPADAAQRIRNLNRRRRYHQQQDRPKVWPGNIAGLCRWAYLQPDTVIDGWCASLAHPDSNEAYVEAWSRLNHLREH